MERIPEPELMDDAEQARAYAAADFEEPHSRFIELFGDCFGTETPGARVLDLGCGPADITVRFARAYPCATVDGIDGAAAMLREGERRVREAGLEGRVRLVEGYLPDCEAPQREYDIVISNSLLHHLPDPMVLWEAVNRWARPGALVFVMDLMRPQSLEEARWMVDEYVAGEPEVLRQDFHNSLLAAWRPDEIREQLAAADLSHLTVEAVSDRHLIVHGIVEGGG